MKLLPVFLLATGLCLGANLNLGSPFTLKRPDSIDKIASAPAAYVGKTIQVKGKIIEVCEMAGCWVNLADSATGKLLKVKVDDGVIVFPKDSAGKLAIVEGKLIKIELTREQAVAKSGHEAKEQGHKFNPASIKSGTTIYQIQGTSALIFE